VFASLPAKEKKKRKMPTEKLKGGRSWIQREWFDGLNQQLVWVGWYNGEDDGYEGSVVLVGLELDVRYESVCLTGFTRA